MNKNEFIKKIADKANATQKDVQVIIDAFQDVLLEDVIATEDSVRLKIGTVSGYTKVTNDRKGRNPLTGEELFIKGTTVKGYPKIKWSREARS